MATNQHTVAMTMPRPTQSTKMTHSMKLSVFHHGNQKYMENPSDVMHRHAARNR